MKCIDGGIMVRGTAFESSGSVGGIVNLPNCGWMRCTQKTMMRVNKDFLVSAGATPNGTCFVVRSFYRTGSISANFIGLDLMVIKEGKGDKLHEASLTRFHCVLTTDVVSQACPRA